MERETYLAAALFGAVTLISILAAGMWFSEPLAIKFALNAIVCGYVVQLADHFVQTLDRWHLCKMLAVLFWVFSVFSSLAAITIIMLAV